MLIYFIFINIAENFLVIYILVLLFRVVVWCFKIKRIGFGFRELKLNYGMYDKYIYNKYVRRNLSFRYFSVLEY